MKLYVKCSRCEAIGEVAHIHDGSYGYGQAVGQLQGAFHTCTGCKFQPATGWQLIENKYFCETCSEHIRAAMDKAMQPVAEPCSHA